MERIVSARLMFHLESHNLRSPLQSGFRKSRSTTDNLIRLETSIREAFVKKQYNISVFFDIKKAYDMSWRYGILRDLYALRYCMQWTYQREFASFYQKIFKPSFFPDAVPISASIYTAELHALRIAIEPISLSCGKKFIIYTDSLSALQSIVSLHSSSHPILVDITCALANHLKKKDIRFCWIPGHAGINGNELADTAARSATGSSERFPIPHSDLKAYFRQKLQSIWQSNWDQQTENKLRSVMPVLAPTVPSSSNLGHTRLTHRHLLFGEPPPYCEIRNVSLSVKHILCDCPHSNHLRHRLFNSVDFTISSILNNSTNSSLVFKFISIKGFIHHI
ncbi:putative RNA-directed DNA polymerase from transposon BS [Trichonephila clavata]|uniref:ribonuclease H n=1 Tax=Trichonephila clavata TaxID=2740835 RepID=A0A8X6I1W2_TRICU|nr:putative RNA-directed DNA polymerase from transposon BS [Trichonephila clavata]